MWKLTLITLSDLLIALYVLIFVSAVFVKVENPDFFYFKPAFLD